MRTLINILFIIVALVSCQRRPLVYDYYPYADLTIEIDWTKAFKDVDEKPTGVSVWFYPQDGGEPIQTYSSNVDSHKAAVGEGLYDVVVFNLTPAELSSTIGFRGTESLSTLEVYSKEIQTSRDPNDRRGLLTQEPAPFAVTVYRDLEVTKQMVEDTWYIRNHQVNPFTLSPSRVIKVTPLRANRDHAVRIYVKGFQNLALNGTYGELSGLAEGVFIDQDKRNTVNARQKLMGWENTLYPGEYSIGETTVEFTTWGLVADDSESTKASIYAYWEGLIELMFLLVDNETKISYTINLDEYNLKDGETETEFDVEIVIEIGFEEDEDITLPDVEPEEGSGSGFDPNVNPWDEEDVPIVVG